MDTKLYDEMAEMEHIHWWFVGRRAVIRDVIRRYASKKGRLLDVGAGTCLNTQDLAREGFTAEALESHKDAIRLAHTVAPDVRIIEEPFPSPKLADRSYDVVTMFDVLEHIEDDRAALREAYRILSPDGVLVLTVPAFMVLWTDHDVLAHHYRRYTRRELVSKLSEAGFDVSFASYYNFFLFPPILGVRLLQKLFGRTRTESDFSRTPRSLNRLLSFVFGSERVLLRYTPLPFGVSVIAVARKQ